MKKLLLGAAVALLPISSMAATVFGFQAGVGNWTHSLSGDFAASAADVNNAADLKNDLQLGKKTQGYSYFLVEHPVPLIPNLKYVNTKLSSSGSGTADSSFSYQGTTYNTTTDLTTSLTLDQTDTILYYEILDNDLISFDLGLNAKMIDGSASVNSTPTSFSGTIPMLYGAVEIGLPAGFALAAEMSTIGAAGNEITDTTAKVTYTTDFNLGVEAGVRTMSIKIDVDSVEASMKFSGMFIGAFLKF